MDITTRSRRPSAAGIPVALAAIQLAVACTGNPPPPTADDACVPPDTSVLAADFDATILSGSHAVRLFADEGEASGEFAEGRLELRAYPDGERPEVGGVPASLYGTMSLELARLGAADTGSTTSEAVDAPGALVLQWRAADAEDAERPEVLIRLGERSNRADQLVFEGAYTVLRVHEANEGRFSGRWESGAPRRPAAGGRFCAVRSDGRGPSGG